MGRLVDPRLSAAMYPAVVILVLFKNNVNYSGKVRRDCYDAFVHVGYFINV